MIDGTIPKSFNDHANLFLYLFFLEAANISYFPVLSQLKQGRLALKLKMV